MAVRTAYPGSQSVGEILTSANFTRLPGGWIGYAETSTSQTGITSVTDLTGLSVTVTVGTSRRIRITGQAQTSRTVADGITLGLIQEGAAVLSNWCNEPQKDTVATLATGSVVLTPTAGSHTYKLTLQRNTGTGTVGTAVGATNPAFILCEDLGPAA